MSCLRVRELLVKALNVDQKKKRTPVAAREGPWARHWRLGIKLRPVTWHSHSTNQPQWVNYYCRCGYQAPWVWHAPDVFFFLPGSIHSLSETELPGAVVLLFVFISHVAHRFSASPCASLHPAEWKKTHNEFMMHQTDLCWSWANLRGLICSGFSSQCCCHWESVILLKREKKRSQNLHLLHCCSSCIWIITR